VRAPASGKDSAIPREDAPLIGPPSIRGRSEPPAGPEHRLLRERLAAGPCFFTDLLGELELSAETIREALWDLVWTGEVTNDAWAPLRAPRLTLARGRAQETGPGSAGGGGAGRPSTGASMRSPRSRFGRHRVAGRSRVPSHPPGRWSLSAPIFAGAIDPAERRRTLAELLLERYGVVTREQVLAEGVPGGFSSLYRTFADLETLGVCRRGYFIEGLGGAQFALPGAVERLRAQRTGESTPGGPRALTIAAVDPAQPYGAALAWPAGAGSAQRRPARVAGAHVVLVENEPALYVERGGRGLLSLTADRERQREALGALADAVRAELIGKLALERIDGKPVVGSPLEGLLVELGFHAGPRRLTLSA